MQYLLKSILAFALIISVTQCTELKEQATQIQSGVTKQLADERTAQVSELNYNLFFSIPLEKQKPVYGTTTIGFNLLDTTNNVVVDFKTEATAIQTIINSDTLELPIENGHIVLPKNHLKRGRNSAQFQFKCSDLSLNRNSEFLYTLLVPDRASTLFPCFDQPSLKASFKLALEIPIEWKAVSNGSTQKIDTLNSTRAYVTFKPSELISTYLFAFTAGNYQTKTATVNGKKSTFYYRESNQQLVQNSIDTLFQLHTLALEYLEQYTQINQPFSKFDFVAIPDFQYGGMEHPGAIFYRASKLFLPEFSSETDLYYRASLIAHETAHMWFGNLVTMSWFDDVWLKEVFANFYAAKIVQPLYSSLNHDFNFVYYHYPSAYSVDRTLGTHAIKQNLDNMQDAGNLYGPIIYKKAPIVMDQLYKLLDDSLFRVGIQNYLNSYAFSNADWDDLIQQFDVLTPSNLSAWSNAWVKQGGMPQIETKATFNAESQSAFIEFHQEQQDMQQQLSVVLLKNDKYFTIPAELSQKNLQVPVDKGINSIDAIIPNGGGFGYGFFKLDALTLQYLSQNIHNIKNPTVRLTSFINLNENALNQQLSTQEYLTILYKAIEEEYNSQILELLLGYLHQQVIYLGGPNDKPAAEQLLLHQFEYRIDPKAKRILLKALSKIYSNPEVGTLLEQLCTGELILEDFNLTELDKINLACELTIREQSKGFAVLNQLAEASLSPERKEFIEYILPSLHQNKAVRTDFFDLLMDANYRSNEIWAEKAMYYLHHPHFQQDLIDLLPEALNQLQNIQKTNDIFFPTSYLHALFNCYNSPEALQIVQTYLSENKCSNYLKNKLLQASYFLEKRVHSKSEQANS